MRTQKLAQATQLGLHFGLDVTNQLAWRIALDHVPEVDAEDITDGYGLVERDTLCSGFDSRKRGGIHVDPAPIGQGGGEAALTHADHGPLDS